MTNRFTGFESGIESIPSQFFSELLPVIDDMDELKATLFGFYLLNQFEGDARYILVDDFLEAESVRRAFKAGDERLRIEAGLGKAVERGVFLSLPFKNEILYFLNSPKGRAAIRKLEAGEWVPDSFLHLSASLNLERPNIYRLYEENIGPLTPLIADHLTAAEKSYHADWVTDAIEIAVVNNARSWRYIETVLKNWKENGRDGSERDDR